MPFAIKYYFPVTNGNILIHMFIRVDKDDLIENISIEYEKRLFQKWGIVVEFIGHYGKRVDYFDTIVHNAIKMPQTDSPIMKIARYRDFKHPTVFHVYIKLFIEY